MRLFALILLLGVFATKTQAQKDNSVFLQLYEISDDGILLNKGWVYKPGDSPDRANPEFNDSDWAGIDPSEEKHHLPQMKGNDIGWFRLKFKVDSNLRGKSYALVISGIGALEIFVNGTMIQQFGRVSSNYKDEQTRFFTKNLLSLTFNNEPVQVIAIRHSLNKKNLYLKFSNKRPVAEMTLKEINKGFLEHVKDRDSDSTIRSIQVSFYLPLGFLLLFLFLSFRLQKEYLYSGIFCIFLFAAILFHIFALSEPVTVNSSNILLLITQLLYVIGAFAYINAIYILFQKKKSWFYYFIVVYGLFSIPFYFISYDLSGYFNAFFFPIINFEFLRLSILAAIRRRKGSTILLITSSVFTVAIMSYIFLMIVENQNSVLMVSICFVIPGIGLSLFYASEFARTAFSLRQRATEVEELSKEMIAKEKEKQQILSEQNITLEKQVEERTVELTRSLKELKETEEQLIQREKMASLGELTAGIAHEIQNPLNFVNNFSEVNTELIDEMKEELKAGKTDDAISLADNIKANNEKIAFHGKRADSIVKGMLQHSRSGSGQIEATDINTLVDECMRLSFHGMRAKDKSFNAKTDTSFDGSIGSVNIVSQEIGRVVLNLFTNAFYSVIQKKKILGENYSPVVTASTIKAGNTVKIAIRDNGNGIPQKVIDKIFQPFFTTKPTGEGTGLGLSMSYDIITKGHGGELKVETKEGEFAEFTIILPV